MESIPLNIAVLYLTTITSLIACSTDSRKQSPTCAFDPRTSFWKTLHTSDVPAIGLAVFPLGSLENHGPHLPLGTDLLLAEALSSHAVNGMQGVSVLPPSPFGASFEHASWLGAIPIHDHNLNGLWDDVIAALVKSGVRKIILVNAHGGQTPNVEIVARAARFRHNALVVSFNAQAVLTRAWKNTEKRAALLETESVYGIHGGLIETAVMMHLFPHLVRKEFVAHFKPRFFRYGQPLEPHGEGISFGWRSEDLSSSGALGDATSANTKLGEAIFSEAVSILRRLIVKVLESDPSELLNLSSE